MKELDVEMRSEKAVEYFKEGYNCAQSVYMAYADIFGLDTELAAKIIAPLGGGMGRLREVCGAVSGMFLVAGLHLPTNDPKNRDMKIRNYAAVQYLANEFAQQNGSIVCRELLGLDVKKEAPIPEERTSSYYKKRPCAEYVRMAATIVGCAIRDEKI
ncbi:MAG: C_GCAxxG_C_C family protein [Paludibacteraceae bacterium]|nr:C_GCAxxG_C_C family protein [Paludibacteraceae bacterium]